MAERFVCGFHPPIAAGDYELVTPERPLVTMRRLSVRPGASEPIRVELR